jgi:hypothetical protein
LFLPPASLEKSVFEVFAETAQTPRETRGLPGGEGERHPNHTRTFSRTVARCTSLKEERTPPACCVWRPAEHFVTLNLFFPPASLEKSVFEVFAETAQTPRETRGLPVCNHIVRTAIINLKNNCPQKSGSFVLPLKTETETVNETKKTI